jgi:hypothetical protein
LDLGIEKVLDRRVEKKPSKEFWSLEKKIFLSLTPGMH